jgi:hypothetical protein
MPVGPFPEQLALDLEAALREPPLLGVPPGDLLGQAWHALLCKREVPAGPLDLWRDRLLLLARRWRSAAGGTLPAGLQPGRFLLTWINPRHHCRDLILPVAAELGAEQCIVLGRDAAMRAAVPPGAGFLTWADLPPPAAGWQGAVGQGRRQWEGRARTVLARHGAPLGLWPRLEGALVSQAALLARCRAALELLRPCLVLTEYDRDARVACLVGAARSLGIPTLTMMHGVLNTAFGYAPLLAEAALCWGEQQRDQMQALGVSAERLLLAGNPRLSRQLSATREEALARAGFPPGKPVVLLASNPIRAELRREFATTFCEAVAGNVSFTPAVRLHPSEALEFYAPERERYPSVRFMANDEWTLDEALAASEVVVCHDSGLGNDALVKGCLVAVLDCLPVPLGNGATLIERAGCPRAGSAEELRRLLPRMLGEERLRRQLRAAAERYIDYFCCAFGADATRAAASIARQRARPRAA